MFFVLQPTLADSLAKEQELEQKYRIAKQKEPDAERTQLDALHQTETEKALQEAIITDKHEEVSYDVATINHENKDSGDSIDKIETDLVKANADLSTATIVLDSMAEGPAKEIQRTKQMAATVRVRSLNERKANSGVVAYFGQEFDLDTPSTRSRIWIKRKRKY